MHRVTSLLPVVMIAVGTVWLLQGINVLPGSFMTGDPKWAVIGGILAAAGVTWLVMQRRS